MNESKQIPWSAEEKEFLKTWMDENPRAPVSVHANGYTMVNPELQALFPHRTNAAVLSQAYKHRTNVQKRDIHNYHKTKRPLAWPQPPPPAEKTIPSAGIDFMPGISRIINAYLSDKIQEMVAQKTLDIEGKLRKILEQSHDIDKITQDNESLKEQLADCKIELRALRGVRESIDNYRRVKTI